MLQVHNLSFRYRGTKQPVLKNVSFSLNPGEIVAVVGRNGSGKSTLGKLVAGIAKTPRGAVTFDDPESRIGIIFQNPENQIIFSSLKDELVFMLKGLSAEEIDRRIDESLARVEMTQYKTANLYELSPGQKQRIVIAEMLAGRPDYLVMDEPTAMIDTAGKLKVHQIIRDLARDGIAILLLTNQSEEIRLANRILILDNASIYEANPSDAKLLKKHGVILGD